MTETTKEIRRIGLYSAIKTGFLAGGLGGFLLGAATAMILAVVVREMMGLDSEVYPDEIGSLMDIGVGSMIVILPLMGGLAGAAGGLIFGFLGTALYNIAAPMWGGLEFTLIDRKATSSLLIPSAGAPTGHTAGNVTPLPTGLPNRKPDSQETTQPPAVNGAQSGDGPRHSPSFE